MRIVRILALQFSDSGDELYDKAVSIVCREKKSIDSFIQRHLQVGIIELARIIEKMESEGVVSRLTMSEEERIR